jgi:hypothetical protein
MFGSVIEVVGVLRAGELGELPDARIEEEFDELHRLVELLEVERLRRLAEIDRRNLFQRDGHLSAVSWLAARYRVPRGAAAEQVRSARALEQMPAARAALGAGEVSLGAAKMLAAARQVDPEAFSRSEPVLVDAARRHSTADLRRVLGFWQERVRQERLEAGGFVKARGCTPRSPSPGWSGSTPTSTPRPEKRSLQRSTP